MNQTELRKLPRDERDRLRRVQIVEAAMNCVITHGFHRATTAMIAREAGFSEGQLYRYFESKEAIMGALVETMTERQLKRIIAAKDSRDLADIIIREMTDDSEDIRKERIIYLEMLAEATRNPSVAMILSKADAQRKAKAVKSLRAEFADLSDEEVYGVAEYIATLNEGRTIRAAQSDSKTTEAFLSIYRKAFSFLLPDEQVSERKQ
ncbi:hypothetical protein C4J81_14165 [Deltaproteobacteria bacterium Smac51]|nr:hypothetical protein C4J81_14165 [Deltaproteobacteria bacterium Smac51]